MSREVLLVAHTGRPAALHSAAIVARRLTEAGISLHVLGDEAQDLNLEGVSVQTASSRPQICSLASLRASRRSVLAFGVVRSWGSTPPAPSSTTSSPPTTPTVSRAVPASSTNRIRYSVKLGAGSVTSTPSRIHACIVCAARA